MGTSYQMLSNENDMTLLVKVIKYECRLSNSLHLFFLKNFKHMIALVQDEVLEKSIYAQATNGACTYIKNNKKD